jgi:hypothetical protein
MPIYDYLNSYPYLKQFCKEEQILSSTYTRTHKELTLQDIIQTNLPEEVQNDSDKRRYILDCCLSFAYRHGLMNPNRRERDLKLEIRIFGQLSVNYELETG